MYYRQSSYPKGLEALKVKRDGKDAWLVMYTPLSGDMNDIREVGEIIKESRVKYLTKGMEFQSRSEAIWHCYYTMRP
jgi:hypothetical protein